MRRHLRQALDRPLVMLVALAVAWFPGGLWASCGCETCECQQQTAAEACCSNSSVAVCQRAPAAKNCCDGATVVARPCRCEIHCSTRPVAPIIRGDQGHSIGADIFAPTAVLSDSTATDGLILEAAGQRASGPPLRVLYCVWRN
jgi:hypothetical protein